MTTTADIFADLNALLGSVDELLRTSIAQEAPNMASELGAESQLNTAVDFFVNALSRLADGVEKLRGPILQADAVVAGLEMIADSLHDLGDGRALRELTTFFSLPSSTFQPLLQAVGKSAVYLNAGLGLSDNFPSPDDLRQTRRRLENLCAALGQLKAKPALPAPTTYPALSNSMTRGNTL